MDIQNREYQLKGVDFLVRKERGILHMDPGLGKTGVALRSLDCLGARKVLVIAGENPKYVWADEEIPKWAPNYSDFILPIEGTPGQRKACYDKLKGMNDFVTFSTIQSLARDLEMAQDLRFDAIVYDEAHKAKNRKTQACKTFKALTKNVPCVIPQSGHIVQKGPADLFGLLNCVDRKRFPSFWDYVNEYCVTVQGPFGLVIGGPRKPAELKALLNEYVYYKSKKDPEVAASLPEKTRQLLPVDMDKVQRQLYNSLVDDMMAEYGGDFVITPNNMSNLIRLQQVLACPKILFPDAPTYGAAVNDVVQRVEETPHCCVYSVFTEAFPYFEEALRKAGHKSVVTFKGGLKREEIAERKREFVGEGGIALLSITYAESLSLDTASYGYILGPHTSQNVNYQAEDRIHRFTSIDPVFLYYYHYHGTVSDWLMHVLDMKSGAQQQTYDIMTLGDLKNLGN